MAPIDPTGSPPSGHADDADAERAAREVLRVLDDVVAPDRLRFAVAEAVADAERSRSRQRRRFQLRLGAGFAAAAAAVAIAALVVVLAVGGSETPSSAPSVQQVAQVALRPASQPAPAVQAADRELLVAKAGPIAFPTWSRAGLRVVGARSDTVGGHLLKTVFYAGDDGRRIGYAIADAPLPARGGRVVTRRGAALRVLPRDGAAIVTWRRDGRTCILAGRGVPVERLLTLASYAAA